MKVWDFHYHYKSKPKVRIGDIISIFGRKKLVLSINDNDNEIITNNGTYQIVLRDGHWFQRII